VLKKMLQSLESRGHVTDVFNWQYHYYTLTDSGVEYLRQYLYIPTDVVPNTHKRQVRPDRPAGRQGDREERGPRGPRRGGDREGGYRGERRFDGDKKDGSAPSGFRPSFRGGRGGRGGAGAGRPASSGAAQE